MFSSLFSSRCLQAVVLVLTISVLVAGFMLIGDFVHEATASGSDCDTAMKECGLAQIAEIIACFGSNSGSQACIQAKGRAASKCLQAVIICQN